MTEMNNNNKNPITLLCISQRFCVTMNHGGSFLLWRILEFKKSENFKSSCKKWKERHTCLLSFRKGYFPKRSLIVMSSLTMSFRLEGKVNLIFRFTKPSFFSVFYFNSFFNLETWWSTAVSSSDSCWVAIPQVRLTFLWFLWHPQ